MLLREAWRRPALGLQAGRARDFRFAGGERARLPVCGGPLAREQGKPEISRMPCPQSGSPARDPLANRKWRGATPREGAEPGSSLPVKKLVRGRLFSRLCGRESGVRALPAKDLKEKWLRTKETVRLRSSTKPRLRPSALLARRSRKAAKNPQRSSSEIRENKHPFALYGWGEKQIDRGSQKTHVCASAPVHEIHESALRARNRRQVEKRRLVAQRPSTHSADVEKNRRRQPASPDNTWMTGYMRRYSARA
ncbi:centriole, cilia and spindle-associated protein-like [Vicugna pacos]|uniref:Centriole, cilia and spindle-associated protein-like n=1 Tax=Vicugna pacos TaxID=30538 RepID=A0ABM5CQZ3_VICPA